MRAITIVKTHSSGMQITVGAQTQTFAFWPRRGDTGLATESLLSMINIYPACFTGWIGGIGARLTKEIIGKLAEVRK